MPPPATSPRQRKPNEYFALLRENRSFRNLWLGQVISLLGDWLNLIASAALIAQLTESGLAIGSLFVVRMLAPFFVSPFAGVVADRYNRKHILIATDLLRAIAVSGFLFVREPQHIWLLYSLTAFQLALSGFFFPTRSAIVPDIVDRDRIGVANMIGAVTWSVMLAAGAAVGGLVAGLWGNETAFVLDAGTFVLSAVVLTRVRYRYEKAGGDQVGQPSILRDYQVGVRYLASHRDVLLVVLHKAVSALLVTSAMQVVQVALAERVFIVGAGGSIGLGLMYAAAGVGTGIGPVAARRFTGDDNRALGLAIGWGYALSATGLLVVSGLTSFPIVVGGVFLRGIGGGIVWVLSTQLLLQMVPGEVRGRVFAMEFALFSLMSAIGAALAGAALDSGIGMGALTFVLAISTLVPALIWPMWWRQAASPDILREDR